MGAEVREEGAGRLVPAQLAALGEGGDAGQEGHHVVLEHAGLVLEGADPAGQAWGEMVRGTGCCISPLGEEAPWAVERAVSRRRRVPGAAMAASGWVWGRAGLARLYRGQGQGTPRYPGGRVCTGEIGERCVWEKPRVAT